MSYKGDFGAGDTINFKFTTRQSTGAPFTLAGSPALSVYKSSSTTESTAGITLTADFDSRTGLNHALIDTSSDGTFYADGGQFDVVITTGTVNSISVVGEVVGRFTLRAQACLYPTTAGRKLDVSAGGEAGLDWANVGSPTTTLALTGTTIASTQKVDVDTIKTNPVVNAGTITFPTGATLASTTNITAGTIATVTNLTNAPTAGDFTATMKASITTSATAATPVATVSGDFSATMKTSLNAATPSVTVSDKTGFSLTSAYDPAKTAAQAGNAMTLTSGERTTSAGTNAAGLLKYDMSTITGEADRSPLNAIRFLRNKWSLSSNTLTVTKEDDTTTAWTATVSTDAAAIPVIGSDPA